MASVGEQADPSLITVLPSMKNLGQYYLANRLGVTSVWVIGYTIGGGWIDGGKEAIVSYILSVQVGPNWLCWR